MYPLKCHSTTQIQAVVIHWLSRICSLRPPGTAAGQASLTFTISRSFVKLMSIESGIPFNHLILCHPFLLLHTYEMMKQGQKTETDFKRWLSGMKSFIFTEWSLVSLWKLLREMGTPDHLTCLLRNLYAGQEEELELDTEQQTGSKLERSTSRLYTVTLLV